MSYVSHNNTVAYFLNPDGLANFNYNAAGGLRFGGTAGQRFTATLTSQNINLNEFSLALGFKVPNSSPPADDSYGICFIGPSDVTVGIAKNIGMWINSDGSLQIYFRNDQSGDIKINAIYSNFIQDYAGKIIHFVFARNLSGNPSIYIDGINKNSSFAFEAGNQWTWQSELTSTYFTIGTIVSGFDYLGDVYYASIYNLVLSASDVSEIYHNHGRVPFRYQWGSFNSLVAGNDSTFSSDTGFWLRANNPPATISQGTLNLNTRPLSDVYKTDLLPFGKMAKISFTVTSINTDTDYILITDIATKVLQTSSGTGQKTFVITGGPNNGVQILSVSGTAIIDNLTFFRLGAVAHYTFERNYNDSSSNQLNGGAIGSVSFLSSSERFFATNFSAENSTNFKRIKRIGKELDFYIQTGPKSSSIATTVLPVSGLFDNQINKFLSQTGDSVSGISIYVPNYRFDKCFLKSMSLNFEPWKPVYANLQFDSYGLASGSGIYSNTPDYIAPSVITPLRATTITLLTGSGFNRDITEYENISFDISIDRAPNFEIGQEYPTTVSVAKITKSLQINGISNLNWVSDYEPNKFIYCNIGMVDGNSISVVGVASTQSLSIDANGVAKTNLTVIEEMV